MADAPQTSGGTGFPLNALLAAFEPKPVSSGAKAGSDRFSRMFLHFSEPERAETAVPVPSGVRVAARVHGDADAVAPMASQRLPEPLMGRGPGLTAARVLMALDAGPAKTEPEAADPVSAAGVQSMSGAGAAVSIPGVSSPLLVNVAAASDPVAKTNGKQGTKADAVGPAAEPDVPAEGGKLTEGSERVAEEFRDGAARTHATLPAVRPDALIEHDATLKPEVETAPAPAPSSPRAVHVVSGFVKVAKANGQLAARTPGARAATRLDLSIHGAAMSKPDAAMISDAAEREMGAGPALNPAPIPEASRGVRSDGVRVVASESHAGGQTVVRMAEMDESPGNWEMSASADVPAGGDVEISQLHRWSMATPQSRTVSLNAPRPAVRHAIEQNRQEPSGSSGLPVELQPQAPVLNFGVRPMNLDRRDPVIPVSGTGASEIGQPSGRHGSDAALPPPVTAAATAANSISVNESVVPGVIANPAAADPGELAFRAELTPTALPEITAPPTAVSAPVVARTNVSAAPVRGTKPGGIGVRVVSPDSRETLPDASQEQPIEASEPPQPAQSDAGGSEADWQAAISLSRFTGATALTPERTFDRVESSAAQSVPDSAPGVSASAASAADSMERRPQPEKGSMTASGRSESPSFDRVAQTGEHSAGPAPLGSIVPGGTTTPAVNREMDSRAPAMESRESAPPDRLGSTVPMADRGTIANRTLEFQVESGEGRVAVRVADRPGGITVDVRTPDARLASTLRGDLPELAARIGQAGYHADIWRPVATATPDRPRMADPAAVTREVHGQQPRGGEQGQRQGQRDSQEPEGSPPRQKERKDFRWLFTSIR